MAALSSETVHATSVAIDGRGVLILGASGAGKSDLALRLIDRGAILVSDDYTIATVRDGALRLNPPANIAGRMEVRHLGLVDAPYVEDVEAVLAIRLEDNPARMPEEFPIIVLAGIALPVIALAGLEASAPVKVELALRHLPRLMGSA